MFVDSGMLPGRPEATKRETPYLLTLSFNCCHSSKAAEAEERENGDTHTLKVGLYTVCVSMETVGGEYTPQSMNGCRAETLKETRASLGLESELVDLEKKKEVCS